MDWSIATTQPTLWFNIAMTNLRCKILGHYFIYNKEYLGLGKVRETDNCKNCGIGTMGVKLRWLDRSKSDDILYSYLNKPTFTQWITGKG